MILIQSTKNRIAVTGHASDAEHPRSDETQQACASITALTQTLLAGVEMVGDHPAYSIGKGNFIMYKDGLSEQAQLLMDVFIAGCLLVEIGYPGMITVQA